MSSRNHYDFIIIGTGAGGCTIAHELAKTGKQILILERGGYLPRERENWDPAAVFQEKRYLARETWYDKDDRPFEPYTHYWVGGNTKMYGAALLRLREHDFNEVQHFGGVSPAWPIHYDDLEPYYLRAERMYHVHGTRGSDPCEGRASGAYPFPPLAPEPRIREMFDDLTAMGHRPFPIPLGVRRNPADPAEAPYRFSNFDGYPDLTEVKADSHVVGVMPALRRPNVRLTTGAYVERLNTNPSGDRVEEIIAIVTGVRTAYRADTVLTHVVRSTPQPSCSDHSTPATPTGLRTAPGWSDETRGYP